MMSHELRTPLNAIGGYVDLIRMGLRGPMTEEQRADRERVRRSQRHLLGVTNDILNFAPIESGRLEYRTSTVPIVDVVAAVTPTIEPQLAAKGLMLDTHAADAELRVAADGEKLGQVLLNLLSNAVKFTPGGGRVTLAVGRGDGGASDDGPMLLRVSDTGVGIPAEKLESIFEPLVQVRSDPAAAREGTGLGLAISRDLARGMGGDLRVDSEVGRGSTFTIVLRRAAASHPGGAADRPDPALAVPRWESAARR